mmetsp:Transcript_33742/g.104183  ORF Transcript_33742/g.104183 Transcript_33742/m.104183 type:complete len:225 (+) Transcript_33742:404-1078(+)
MLRRAGVDTRRLVAVALPGRRGLHAPRDAGKRVAPHKRDEVLDRGVETGFGEIARTIRSAPHTQLDFLHASEEGLHVALQRGPALFNRAIAERPDVDSRWKLRQCDEPVLLQREVLFALDVEFEEIAEALVHRPGVGGGGHVGHARELVEHDLLVARVTVPHGTDDGHRSHIAELPQRSLSCRRRRRDAVVRLRRRTRDRRSLRVARGMVTEGVLRERRNHRRA